MSVVALDCVQWHTSHRLRPGSRRVGPYRYGTYGSSSLGRMWSQFGTSGPLRLRDGKHKVDNVDGVALNPALQTVGEAVGGEEARILWYMRWGRRATGHSREVGISMSGPCERRGASFVVPGAHGCPAEMSGQGSSETA